MRIAVPYQRQMPARPFGAWTPAAVQGVGNCADDHHQVTSPATCLMLSNNSGRLRLAHFFQVNSKIAQQFLAELIERSESHFKQRLSARPVLNSPDANENGLTHAQRSFAPGAKTND